MNRPLLTLKKKAAPLPKKSGPPVPWGAKKAMARDVLAKLIDAHPEVFFPSGSDNTQPLAVGIKADVIKAHPELKPFHIGIALSVYTGKSRYLRALTERSARVDLSGEPVQPIPDEHRRYALAILVKRTKNMAKHQRQAHADRSAQAAPSAF